MKLKVRWQNSPMRGGTGIGEKVVYVDDVYVKGSTVIFANADEPALVVPESRLLDAVTVEEAA